jgi:hypothetical protein
VELVRAPANLYTKRVQLAFLGKIGEHTSAALDLVSYCVDTLNVNRVIYVGADDAIERALGRGERRDTPPPFDLSRRAFWERSLRVVDAAPAAVSEFVVEEQRLLSLLQLETLAVDAPGASAHIATWGPYSVCAKLTEDAPSNAARLLELVVHGAGHRPLLPETDESLRFAPGSLAEAGLLLLTLSDDPERSVEAKLIDRGRRCQRRCHLHLGG